MWTLISVSLGLLITFYSPNIRENKKSIKNSYVITGFPYQYFQQEVLTNEMVESRIRVIYLYFMIFIICTFLFGTVGYPPGPFLPIPTRKIDSKPTCY